MKKVFSNLGLVKSGTIDYIKDDDTEIVQNSPVRTLLIRKDKQEADLARFVAEYGPGSIAVLEGLSHIWQLKVDGTLETVI